MVPPETFRRLEPGESPYALRGKSVRTRSSRPAPYFFAAAALTMLLVMCAGFYPFYLRAEGMAGRKIPHQLLALVSVHGAAMTSWVVLFLVQTLLIPTRNVRVHMKLGWVGVGVAVVIAVSGFVVAVQSVRLAPGIPFWGMAYRQFLLVMLAEATLFSLFVIAAVAARRRPKTHRVLMLLATLSILAGATVRMPLLFPVFGEAGWPGIFGPVFAIGAVFLLVRSIWARAFDAAFAAGYALMVLFYVVACKVALTGAWSNVAETLFGV